MGRPAPLRHDCVEVPWRVDGTVNGNCVVASVESGLAPTLNSRGIVVRDHLASHKTNAVRAGSRAISAAGAALLHLPKDASDLNPIE